MVETVEKVRCFYINSASAIRLLLSEHIYGGPCRARNLRYQILFNQISTKCSHCERSLRFWALYERKHDIQGSPYFDLHLSSLNFIESLNTKRKTNVLLLLRIHRIFRMDTRVSFSLFSRCDSSSLPRNFSSETWNYFRLSRGRMGIKGRRRQTNTVGSQATTHCDPYGIISPYLEILGLTTTTKKTNSSYDGSRNDSERKCITRQNCVNSLQ